MGRGGGGKEHRLFSSHINIHTMCVCVCLCALVIDILLLKAVIFLNSIESDNKYSVEKFTEIHGMYICVGAS